MKSKQVAYCDLRLKFDNELRLENPEDFNLTTEQAKQLKAQLSALIERAKTGVNVFTSSDVYWS